MTTLKNKLTSLSEDEQAMLVYAFDHGLCQVAKLPGTQDEFLGVNIKRLANFEVITESGDWAYGRIKKA
jgi:hypothetical protein